MLTGESHGLSLPTTAALVSGAHPPCPFEHQRPHERLCAHTTLLGSAIHWLQRRSNGASWAAVLDAMQDAGLDLGAQGLSDAASTVVKLREDVARWPP